MKIKNNKGEAIITWTMVVVLASVLGISETLRQKGHWGKDGSMAVKNCPGTHVNDNCAHLKITDL